jgi:hypothetical protein
MYAQCNSYDGFARIWPWSFNQGNNSNHGNQSSSIVSAQSLRSAETRKISWLMLLIAVYSETHTKPINAFCGLYLELLNVKVCGTNSYRRVLNDWIMYVYVC